MTTYEIKAIILRDDATIGGTCPAAQIRFPATRYELADALERARVSASHSGFTLTEYQCHMPGLAELLPSRTHLEELNLLAHRLAKLSEWDRMAYEGLLKMDDHPKTLGNLVNLTHNLAACQCADVHDDAHLGKFLAYNDLVPELDGVSDVVRGWLDWSRVGAYKRRAEHGVFVTGGYVVNDATGWKPLYPEDLQPGDVPEQDAPMDGIFRVFAAGIPEGIVLPMSEREQADLISKLGSNGLDNLTLSGAYSSIPPLNAMLEPFESFPYLNEIAAALAEIPETERLKLKAVLEYEGCADLSQAVKISRSLDLYEHLPELSSPEDYKAHVISAEMTGGLCPRCASRVGPVPPWAPLLSEGDFYRLITMSGEAMMMQDDAQRTPYGIVRHCKEK